jgi:hypothetical protein
MKKPNVITIIAIISLMAFGGWQQAVAQIHDANENPDYVMLNLKGKVKSYKIDGEVSYWDIVGSKVEFDRNGKIIGVEGNTPKLLRNRKGQIAKYSYEFYAEEFEEWGTRSSEFTYNQDGQITNILITTPYDKWNNGFVYDRNGDIAFWIVKSSIDPEWQIVYKYQEYDQYGNWTKRTIDGVPSVRTITYWE